MDSFQRGGEAFDTLSAGKRKNFRPKMRQNLGIGVSKKPAQFLALGSGTVILVTVVQSTPPVPVPVSVPEQRLGLGPRSLRSRQKSAVAR